ARTEDVDQHRVARAVVEDAQLSRHDEREMRRRLAGFQREDAGPDRRRLAMIQDDLQRRIGQARKHSDAEQQVDRRSWAHACYFAAALATSGSRSRLISRCCDVSSSASTARPGKMGSAPPRVAMLVCFSSSFTVKLFWLPRPGSTERTRA